MDKWLVMSFAIMGCCTCLMAKGEEKRIPAKGFAVFDDSGEFKPFEFTRRPVGDNDILIEIMYAGICHSDVHHVRQDWGKTQFPTVPGHEIAGRVIQVGKDVTQFKVGDYAGVGCWIASCSDCDYCKTEMEHLCKKRVLSFASVDHTEHDEPTYGGYSSNYVISEDFAVKIPQNVPMERVAPLLCAGITTYTPIRFSDTQKGDKVGVAGFGGLGHMAVKYAVSLGADVVVFDITEEKREDALRMGAKKYVNVNKPEDLEGLEDSLDLIIDTIPFQHDPLMYLQMLKLNGEMAIVGLPPNAEVPMIPTSALPMLPLRKVYGSNTGSIRQTQEMMDYSVSHELYPDVKIIPADGKAITEAYQKIIDGEVKFRYVIDMGTLK
ncbi:MAG: NAD(P)-dependent alcohol dehydrogenase [Planctomycetia bacterium]|nr:NAD(P)-dependent alcohol dehydrogenase [Planctomycetia bacterium]